MRKRFIFSCNIEKIHPDLVKVFTEKEPEKEITKFGKKKNIFHGTKYFLYNFLREMGMSHYEVTGWLGYKTFLVSTKYVGNILLRNHKIKSMLDIGAGSGSITQKFKPFVEKISFIEPSESFKRNLIKKGFIEASYGDGEKYDLVTIFNVLDICENPNQLIQRAINLLGENGKMIISLPFPIMLRRDGILAKNGLKNQINFDFEKAVSDFYVSFLQPNNLEVCFFSRLPYQVLSPEGKNIITYDNGLFIVKKNNFL